MDTEVNAQEGRGLGAGNRTGQAGRPSECGIRPVTAVVAACSREPVACLPRPSSGEGGGSVLCPGHPPLDRASRGCGRPSPARSGCVRAKRVPTGSSEQPRQDGEAGWQAPAQRHAVLTPTVSLPPPAFALDSMTFRLWGHGLGEWPLFGCIHHTGRGEERRVPSSAGCPPSAGSLRGRPAFPPAACSG